MAQISYTNKVALNENPEIADINKITDDDMNEIKQVVNDNYNNTIQITDTEPSDNDNKLWIDTGEVSSSASEITNEYSTSTGLGYSANYINNINTYSTSETDTGMKWIDNKPIYRKCFTFDYASGSTTASESTGITNIDNVVKLESVIKKTYTGYNDFENGNYNSGNTTGRVFYRSQNNTIEIRTTATSVNSTYYVILEYTKTTD